MKTEKETKQDELAAIGIGAMIVFIALILVAAVAAAVIIQTAEKLQQNAQASGDDTQEQMSTKLTLINVVIETIDLGADATAGTADDTYELFATFELAPGSEPTENEDIGYTVICSDGAGANTLFAQGDLIGATTHTEDGRSGDVDAVPAGTPANPVALTLNPGTTYVVVLDVTECAPAANTDHVMLFTVEAGGSTYEELQYGSSPAVGDVVV
ncbi:MAG: hypothetical protein VXV89_03740 [Candidatus Thermoplasmatota archaeon]|nr:hypothetical protein [Candidatus Thermoplasmatota archaeon]